MIRCSVLAVALALGGCLDTTETPPTTAPIITTDEPVESKSSDWIPVGLTKPVVGETYDFTVVDTAGKTITSRHLRGKVVVIDFWATWCLPCRAAIPHLKELYDQYHDKGLEIVGISMDRSQDDLEKFVNREGISWPQVWGGTLVESLDKTGIRRIPTYLVIDRDGKLVKQDRGLSSSLIEELIGE